MKAQGIISLIGYSIAIGTLGFFTRMVDGIDLMTIVFFRTLLAALFILGFVLMTKKAADLIPNNPILLLFNAFCQGGMMVTFIGAVLYTSITNTYFFNHTAPIFAILFSWLFLKENIHKSTVISIIISFVGMMLIIDFNSFSLRSDTVFGDLLALASGILFAGSMVSSKVLTRTNSSVTITFWQMALTAAALIPFIQMPSAVVLLPAALPLIGMGCIATGLSYVLFVYGVEHLEAQVVLIIPTLGLLFPMVGAWVLYAETLSASGIAGCMLIVIGVLTSQLGFGRSAAVPDNKLQPASVGQ
ncbi:MAG: EamA family transporter [Chloroflexota bacterium]